MKKIILYTISLIFCNSLIAQTQSVTITGQSTVEVGIPYNYTLQFMPVYPTNINSGITANSYIITEWVVTTSSNCDGSNPSGYIGTSNNSGCYYNNSTYNGSNPLTIPIQWGSGGNVALNYDTITVKVSGIYRYSNTGEDVGYFQYLTNTKSVTIERLNAPIIAGPSPIASCNQTNQTYSISNATNSTSKLWSVTNGATIVGSNTATTAVVKPPLLGNFTVNCEVKRTGANSNYVKTGSKTITRNPFISSAAISGENFFCTSGTYSVTGLVAGEYVSLWSVSNTSIATLSSTSGSSITLTKIAEGLITLSATISNTCGENVVINKDLVVGRPFINVYQIQGGYDNVAQGSNSNLYVLPPTGGNIFTYTWSIVPFDATGCSSLPFFTYTGSSVSKVVIWGGCTGTYRVRCYVSNGCNIKYYSDKVVHVFDAQHNPCPQARMSIQKNPITIGDDVVLNLIDYPDLPPCNGIEFRSVNSVSVYDLKNNELFKKK